MRKNKSFFLAVFSNFNKDDADQMAAAISFYATFALVPFTVIALAVAGFFYDREYLKDWIFLQLSRLIGDEMVPFWQEVFDKTFAPYNNFFAFLIGVVVLFFVTMGLFIQLKDALNRIFKTHEIKFHGMKLLFRQGILPFLLVVSVGFLLIAVVIAQTMMTTLGAFIRQYVFFPGYFVELIFSTVILVFVFSALYKVLAKIKLEWFAVFFGACISAVFLQIGIFLISLFFKHSGILSIYSAAASMVAVLYWIFFSSQIFLFGAEVVYETHIRIIKAKQLSKK